MNTEKKKDLIALRNWALSILGIAIIIGVGVVLLSSDDSAEPVEVRPYDPADTLDAADMESPVDWLGASNGKPAGSTGAPEPAAAKPAAPGNAVRRASRGRRGGNHHACPRTRECHTRTHLRGRAIEPKASNV